MRQALATTAISRDYLDDVLNGMSDAVLVMAPDGRVQTANAAAAGMFGFAAKELPGREFADLIAPEHRAAFDLERMKTEPGETVIRTERGQTIPVSVNLSPLGRAAANESRGTIVVLRDITERKRAERRIRYLARYDTLTKMPNRLQFQHLLHQAITRNTRQGRGLVLLYVDIDNFKEVNDTFGHETGDRVLETISESRRATTRVATSPASCWTRSRSRCPCPARRSTSPQASVWRWCRSMPTTSST